MSVAGEARSLVQSNRAGYAARIAFVSSVTSVVLLPIGFPWDSLGEIDCSK